MNLVARGIALQGFLLTPIAMAVQGLLAAPPVDPPIPAPTPRRADYELAGGGPGNNISFADYLKRFAPLPVPTTTPTAAPTTAPTKKKRQRMEEELLFLLQDF